VSSKIVWWLKLRDLRDFNKALISKWRSMLQTQQNNFHSSILTYEYGDWINLLKEINKKTRLFFYFVDRYRKNMEVKIS